MKSKLAIGGLILAVVVLAASMVLGRGLAQEYSGQKWEYAQGSFNLESRSVLVAMADEELKQELSDLFEDLGLMGLSNTVILNEFGSRGWELVQVESRTDDNPTNTFTFKRPLS